MIMTNDNKSSQQLNRDIYKAATTERFPISNMNKESVRDAEIMKSGETSVKSHDQEFPISYEERSE